MDEKSVGRRCPSTTIIYDNYRIWIKRCLEGKVPIENGCLSDDIEASSQRFEVASFLNEPIVSNKVRMLFQKRAIPALFSGPHTP